jgi:formylglycine-generating enzyme required for sulfatase activity
MKNPSLPLVLTLWALSFVPFIRAAEPTVSNVRAAQKTGTKQVEIFYDISGATSPVFVSLQISADGGTTFAVPASTLSGHVGAAVVLGNNRKITWNAGADWNNQLSNTVKFRVTASDVAPVGNMVFISGGTFQMGDALDGLSNAPVHSVYVSGFYLQNTEVTKAQWDAVANWAAANGYDINAAGGSGKAANHPVHYVTWYEVVKYCNARSQMENLTPCYTSGDSTYKTGTDAGVVCNWSASGYRLPTEAEWEKAARGGLSGKRFPWGDIINHSYANYYNGSYSYESPQNQGYHPTYNDGVTPYTSPVGSFPANGYGLYDMAGNLWEWCWDWYGSSYYSTSPGTDPRGPASGSYRVYRGGGWSYYALSCRVAYRGSISPTDSNYGIGFRPARSSVP